jgi:acetoin utilization protein AcuB
VARTSTERQRATGAAGHASGVAADIMTENPRTVQLTDSVEEALTALELMDVRHLPVVDEHNEPVGMLSDRDLRSVPLGTDDEAVATRARIPVSELMSGGVVAAHPETRIAEVIEMLLENRIGAVPVVDADQHVVGVVSYVDVLRAVA